MSERGRLCLAGGGGPGQAPRDVYVEDGRIAGVRPAGEVPSDWEVMRCHGLWVLPGLVDLCAHLPSPPRAWREDAGSLAAAAAAGGFTTVCAVTGEHRPEALLSRRPAPPRLVPVAAATYAGGLAELDRLAAAGALAYSDDPRAIGDAGLMRRVLQYAERPVAVQAEDPALAAGGVAHEGAVASRLGLAGIPASAETAAVARDLLLLREAPAGARLHLAHLSSAGAVDLVRRAKEEGLAVTAAVAIHHLLVDVRALAGYDTALRLSPPLREEADRVALLRAVADGTLDAIVSDHTACPPEEKEVPFAEAAPGAAALEVVLAAALAVLPPEVAVSALSERPARVFGLPAGRLAPGLPADLTLVDPSLEWTVAPEAFVSRGHHSPLGGRRLRGRAVATLVGGTLNKNAVDSIISGAPSGAGEA